MGWARYAHSMRVFCFNSGLFYIRPTPAALDLLKRVMQRLETEKGWDQQLFNEVLSTQQPRSAPSNLNPVAWGCAVARGLVSDPGPNGSELLVNVATINPIGMQGICG